MTNTAEKLDDILKTKDHSQRYPAMKSAAE